MTVGGHNGFLPYMSIANGIAASLDGPSRAAVSLLPVLTANMLNVTARAGKTKSTHAAR